jgi:hypothetical protein
MMTVGTLNLLYLLAARVMSVILLGMRAGLVVLALSAISMMLLGLTGYSPSQFVRHGHHFQAELHLRGRIPHAHLRQVD